LFLHLNGVFLVRSGREGNKKALRNNLEIKKKKTQTILDMLPVKFECCYPIPNMDI
jgi:hypothetical protein